MMFFGTSKPRCYKASVVIKCVVISIVSAMLKHRELAGPKNVGCYRQSVVIRHVVIDRFECNAG